MGRCRPVANARVTSRYVLEPLHRTEFLDTIHQGPNCERPLVSLLSYVMQATAISLSWDVLTTVGVFNDREDNMHGVRVLTISEDIWVARATQSVRMLMPKRLRVLRITGSFNSPMDGVVWPESLAEMSLEGGSTALFNQPLENITWPPNSREFSVNTVFNRPIEGVAFGDSIVCMHLGG